MIRETDVMVGVEAEVEATEAEGMDGKTKSRIHHQLTKLRRRRPQEMKVRRGGTVQVSCTHLEHLYESTKGNWLRVIPPVSQVKGRNVGSSTLRLDAMIKVVRMCMKK